MVWAIFAPKYIFDSLAMLAAAMALLAVVLLNGRMERMERRAIHKQQHTD